MSPNSGLQEWLRRVRRSWNVLIQGSVWIIAIISTFLRDPPSAGNVFKVHSLTKFVVAAAVGLMFVPTSRWRHKKHTILWWAIAVLLLIVSVVEFFLYQQLVLQWTVTHNEGSKHKETLVIGSEYVDGIESYIEETGRSDPKILLGDALWVATSVWTAKSIARHARILAGLFISNAVLFAVCIIAIAQAIYCNNAKGIPQITSQTLQMTSGKRDRFK